ncbi:MAG TPA: histidine phosphatase family protein [Dongiaceae bacterium]|nr:histidine phosphatase family protein [Dongiaceae bacterium]
MIATRWWWIRHAPVTCHGGRIYGQRDLPADCADKALFAALASRLPAGARWIVTPLRRTRQTAEALIAAGAPVPAEMREEPGFLEQHFGDWQGLSHAELAALNDGAAHRFWLAPAAVRPPGGESFSEVVARVAAAIDRISADTAGGDVVAIAHGGSIRAALALALGLEAETALRFAIDNCSLTRLDHFAAEGSWRVGAVNLIARPDAPVSA